MIEYLGIEDKFRGLTKIEIKKKYVYITQDGYTIRHNKKLFNLTLEFNNNFGFGKW